MVIQTGTHDFVDVTLDQAKSCVDGTIFVLEYSLSIVHCPFGMLKQCILRRRYPVHASALATKELPLASLTEFNGLVLS